MTGATVRGRVAFVTSNGGGLGHLTRTLAVARRLPDDVAPVVITQSHAIGLVRDAGVPVEHLPGRHHLRVPLDRWHRYARTRTRQLLEERGADVVVFDGAVPPEGLLDAFDDAGAVRVWLRRATWRATAEPRWAALSDRFDLTIEPEDLAVAADHGPTVVEHDRVVRCAPITFADADEALEPAVARAELGLSPERPTALVTLGAGNIDDTATPLGRFVDGLRRRGFDVAVTRSPIAEHDPDVPPDVRVLRTYPIGRHLRAFDLAVAAAGYNAVHELIGLGVPTVLVPNRRTGLDDQVTRARALERAGAAVVVEDVEERTVAAALDLVVLPGARTRLTRRAVALRRPNGAHRAAAVLASAATASPATTSPATAATTTSRGGTT